MGSKKRAQFWNETPVSFPPLKTDQNKAVYGEPPALTVHRIQALMPECRTNQSRPLFEVYRDGQRLRVDVRQSYNFRLNSPEEMPSLVAQLLRGMAKEFLFSASRLEQEQRIRKEKTTAEAVV